MKLWLSQRFGRAKETDASSAKPGHGLGKVMHIESLEHVVRNRVRTFLRHTWLVTVLGTVILGGVVWGAIYFWTAPTEIRIAAGPAGSANVKLVELLTNKFAAEDDKIRLKFVPTGGPKESAEAITDNSADLAILPSTTGDSPNWSVVAILRKNVIAFIVPPQPVSVPAKKEAATPVKKEPSRPEKPSAPEKKSKNDKGDKSDKSDKAAKGGDKNTKAAKNDKGAKSDTTTAAAKGDDTDASDDGGSSDAGNKLEKVSQLAGHRVGIVTGNVATADLLEIVLKHYGVPLDKVEVSKIDPKNIADAVKAKQVDVLFVAGSATGQAINDAVTAASQDGKAPSFIAIDQADGIAKRYPAFDSVDIDAGTFGGNPPSPDDTLKSLTFAEYLVARKSFNHEAIATLAKLIFSSRLALAAAMLGEIKITAPSTEKDAGVVVHPGALSYLTDDQKNFFDRYGDDIFYGLLIFPIFGSAIAGVASYFRNNGRTRRLRLLQRLLDLVRKAHDAPSHEALDHMQVDLDHLVVAIIHQSEHDENDQGASFSLALDQARFAIAARRAALLNQAAADAKPGAKAAAA
jgi:TRAP-type uncharacterized transport system substrate-binding protein